ncbi:MAG: MBL fold metallo-hydrolase [Acidimicrobiales bacterium]
MSTGIEAASSQRDAWAAGELPPVEQVVPGIWSIPVPVPIPALRYVLVYALELADGVGLVDAGWDYEASWQALSAGLALSGHSVSEVQGVVVTHVHPDHYGLARRVREASGAWVAMHPLDAALVLGTPEDMGELVAAEGRLLASCGIAGAEMEELLASTGEASGLMARSRPDRLLAGGDRVPFDGWDLKARWTPGHSPGHLCFYERGARLLFSGDHVLARISSNVPIHLRQREDPLADFMASLRSLHGLEVAEVLAAHEYRFRGLDARIDQLLAHHEARLAEVLGVLGEASALTCFEVAQLLTWSRPWPEVREFMRRSAVGETLAHLRYLLGRRLVSVSEGIPLRWAVVPGGASR